MIESHSKFFFSIAHKHMLMIDFVFLPLFSNKYASDLRNSSDIFNERSVRLYTIEQTRLMPTFSLLRYIQSTQTSSLVFQNNKK